jgi:LmbE family N-acetylglucosaminyl deacetylase
MTGAPRELRAEELSGWRVLVLGPHPDDFDAISVTLRGIAAQAGALHAAVVRTGSGVLDSYAPALDWEKKAAIREREQRASLRFFGLPDERATFLSLDNDSDEGQLCDTPRNRAELAAVVAERAPDLVFLPHGNDTNSAHRALYAMTRDIVSERARPVTLLLIRDPKTVAMRTDLYTPFGAEEAAWKAQMLRVHDTQHQRNLLTRGSGFDDRILGGNRQIARDLGLSAPYAEAFEAEVLGSPR